MDFNPLILAAIVSVVGLTEGLKKRLPNTSSTLVSIIATTITALSITNLDGFTATNIVKFAQGFVFNMAAIVGGSWLMYESIIKKYKGETK